MWEQLCSARRVVRRATGHDAYWATAYYVSEIGQAGSDGQRNVSAISTGLLYQNYILSGPGFVM